MLKFEVKEFIDVFIVISDLASKLDGKEIDLDMYLTPDTKNNILPTLELVRSQSDCIGLDVSVGLLDQVVRDMQGEYTASALKRDLTGLKGSIRHEIEIAPLVLNIRREKVGYFESATPFGGLVADRFPSSNFDIDEASKCFALARFTACVMHLQRVVETGLRAYVRGLQMSGVLGDIRGKNPNWSNILRPIGDEIKARNLPEKHRDKDQNKKWASDYEKDFCEGVLPFLEAVKTAWRNPSMHAGSQYDEEQTEDIYAAVKGFMHYLSKCLNEGGTFDAR